MKVTIHLEIIAPKESLDKLKEYQDFRIAYENLKRHIPSRILSASFEGDGKD